MFDSYDLWCGYAGLVVKMVIFGSIVDQWLRMWKYYALEGEALGVGLREGVVGLWAEQDAGELHREGVHTFNHILSFLATTEFVGLKHEICHLYILIVIQMFCGPLSKFLLIFNS